MRPLFCVAVFADAMAMKKMKAQSSSAQFSGIDMEVGSPINMVVRGDIHRSKSLF